jgi:endoglucanase Acf2
MRAQATFTVSDFTPAPVPAPDIATALPVGVATMAKTYTGGTITGRSQTIFTSAFDPARGTGTYVALESFEGEVDGRRGTFNFVHTASTSGDDRSDEVFFIVPHSGTGDLATITGSGGIAIDADGTHRIHFDYQL